MTWAARIASYIIWAEDKSGQRYYALGSNPSFAWSGNVEDANTFSLAGARRFMDSAVTFAWATQYRFVIDRPLRGYMPADHIEKRDFQGPLPNGKKSTGKPKIRAIEI